MNTIPDEIARQKFRNAMAALENATLDNADEYCNLHNIIRCTICNK